MVLQDLLYHIFIGNFAPITSSLFGIAASLTLAIPAIRTIRSREAMLKIARSKFSLSNKDTLSNAEKVFLDKAISGIKVEKKLTWVGLTALCVSFGILGLHSLNT